MHRGARTPVAVLPCAPPTQRFEPVGFYWAPRQLNLGFEGRRRAVAAARMLGRERPGAGVKPGGVRLIGPGPLRDDRLL